MTQTDPAVALRRRFGPANIRAFNERLRVRREAQRESYAAGRRRRTVRTSAGLGGTIRLQQLAKLFDSEPGVADDIAEVKCIDGVVARDSEDTCPVGHNDVLALANHRKSGFSSARTASR